MLFRERAPEEKVLMLKPRHLLEHRAEIGVGFSLRERFIYAVIAILVLCKIPCVHTPLV